MKSYIDVSLEVHDIRYDIKVREDLRVHQLLREIHNEFSGLPGQPGADYCLFLEKGVRPLADNHLISRFGNGVHLLCVHPNSLPTIGHPILPSEELNQWPTEPISHAEYAYLVLEEPNRAPRAVTIKDTVTVLGRDGDIRTLTPHHRIAFSEADYRDYDLSSFSRLHAVIIYQDHHYYIAQLNEKTQTRLNGDLLEIPEGRPLQEGDELVFGSQPEKPRENMAIRPFLKLIFRNRVENA